MVEAKPVFSSLPEVLETALVELEKVPDLWPDHPKFRQYGTLFDQIQRMSTQWAYLPDGRKEAYESLLSQFVPTSMHIMREGNQVMVAKEEYLREAGSNFGLIYWPLFLRGELTGQLDPLRTPVVECSTGNAGRAFAWTARELGYLNATVITHEDTPGNRKKRIGELEADLIFSPAGLYTRGYVSLLREKLQSDRNTKRNKNIPRLDWLRAMTKIDPLTQLGYLIFAKEQQKQVKEQFGAEARISKFFSVLGSGTTCSGVGLWMKAFDPSIEMVPIELESSAVVTYMLKERKPLPAEKWNNHGVWGTGAFGMELEEMDYNEKIINPDRIRLVTDFGWQVALNILHSKEGKRVGKSSAMELAVALSESSQFEPSENLIYAFMLHDSYSQYEDDGTN
jgi:cysteine synthase